ncbi:hypothetical protein M427DRAFT_97351, partial [Gonapodya prolifera JEL478]
YEKHGQVAKAVALLEHVVTIQEGTMAEDHPDKLASQHALAMAYQALAEVPLALALLEHVIRQRTLADDHPDRLTSQNDLALAYQEHGEMGNAVVRLEPFAAIRERTLSENHPSRIVPGARGGG